MSEPRKILWSERDPGQRFSLAMGALLFLLAAGVMAFLGIKEVLAGSWLGLAAVAAFVSGAFSIWQYWKQRNAR